MLRFTYTICLLCIFLRALSPSARADTLLHLTNDPGSGSGRKEDVTLSEATGATFQLQRGFGGSIQIYVDSNHGSMLNYSSEFGAPDGSLLAVGTYSDTTVGVDDTVPRLTIYESNNAITTSQAPGKFQVLEVTYDAGGNVLTFAVDFFQSSTYDHAICSGQIRYNSVVPYLSQGRTAELANATESVAEKAGSLTVTISRAGGSVGPLAVGYATADGSDLAGRDYTAVTGKLTWADGDASDRTVTIPILDPGNPAQGS